MRIKPSPHSSNRCFSIPVFRFTLLSALLSIGTSALGRTLQVPSEHKTIQAAIDASVPGDVIVVAAGTYKERIQLKEKVTVRSAGDDAKGKLGLKRAEATILDHPEGKGPGVTMAEGSILNGFTITGVGQYDDDKWKKHHTAA